MLTYIDIYFLYHTLYINSHVNYKCDLNHEYIVAGVHYVFLICRLPTIGDNILNERYMPVLANGHIGVTAFTDTLYLNGLYSGKGGKEDEIVCDSDL